MAYKVNTATVLLSEEEGVKTTIRTHANPSGRILFTIGQAFGSDKQAVILSNDDIRAIVAHARENGTIIR
jgi:hypothetical protein